MDKKQETEQLIARADNLLNDGMVSAGQARFMESLQEFFTERGYLTDAQFERLETMVEEIESDWGI